MKDNNYIKKDLLSSAIAFASMAHANQIDKGGNPYILHPLRVMLSMKDTESQICAVLHDVIENTNFTLDDLRKFGIPESIVKVLDCLTRRKGESYDKYIDRILANKLACKVKMADLTDNMDLSRIPNPTQKDFERMGKYRKTMNRIQNVIKG